MHNKSIFTRSMRPKGSTLLYHIGALVAVTAWGIAFINTKILLQYGLSAVEVYIYRFIIAYLCVFLMCPRPFFSNSWSDEFKFLLCGICGNSIYFIAENTAVNYTLVTNVSLIVTTSPLITAMLIGLIYKSERPNRGFMTGSVLAFMGVACVIFNSSFVVNVKPFGDMLALLSAVYSVWFVTRKTFFYGLLTSIPFLAVEPHIVSWNVLMQPAVWGNLCFLGLLCSLLAYVLWAQAVKGLGVMKSGNYLYVSPIVTLVASAVFLDETVSIVGYIGCAMILIGVILSEKLGSKLRN